MKRVHLGDDRLRPERVGEGKKKPGAESGGEQARKLDRDPGDDRSGQCSIHRRCHVQGMRRLARDDPGEDVAEAVVKRISLPRREIDRADAGLERRCVAEIKARQQREVIAGERDQCHADSGRTTQNGSGIPFLSELRKKGSRTRFARLRGQPFSEPGSGGVERGASLVSIG